MRGPQSVLGRIGGSDGYSTGSTLETWSFVPGDDSPVGADEAVIDISNQLEPRRPRPQTGGVESGSCAPNPDLGLTISTSGRVAGWARCRTLRARGIECGRAVCGSAAMHSACREHATVVIRLSTPAGSVVEVTDEAADVPDTVGARDRTAPLDRGIVLLDDTPDGGPAGQSTGRATLLGLVGVSPGDVADVLVAVDGSVAEFEVPYLGRVSQDVETARRVRRPVDRYPFDGVAVPSSVLPNRSNSVPTTRTSSTCGTSIRRRAEGSRSVVTDLEQVPGVRYLNRRARGLPVTDC